ncbi:hypothetical protein M2159_007352 [Streptomyces sp. SAI-090]|nr:hypothetical protein [Streptomyces sp. SAI-090]
MAAGVICAKTAACSLADGAGGCTSSAARPDSFSGRPMVKSMPSGPVTSRSRKAPGSSPETRRTTSQTRKPYVNAWYPDTVPGSHQGSVAASRRVVSSQSKSSAREWGARSPDSPARCESRCRTRTRSLPAAANSGQ